MANNAASVTETEFAILNVLWEQERVAIREIVESIYDSHTHSRHAGIKSLLERLMEKGYVECHRDGPSHRFTATMDRQSFVTGQLQLLADSNYGGSLTPLLLTLIENVPLNQKDRSEISKIIERMN